MRAHIVDNFAHPSEQSGIVQRWLGHVDAIPAKLASVTVRTGTGPSLAAIPPNSSRVINAVLAPWSPARSAATTPAGPAPITTTSIIFSLRCTCEFNRLSAQWLFHPSVASVGRCGSPDLESTD